jgi:hypothetical protein
LGHLSTQALSTQGASNEAAIICGVVSGDCVWDNYARVVDNATANDTQALSILINAAEEPSGNITGIYSGKQTFTGKVQ